MTSLQESNPGTVVVWKFAKQEKYRLMRIFRYVFWAFRPCIEAYKHTFPVVMVDGTHLRGAYKGKMLVAVVKTANNHILPLAYAVVDDETIHSWTWFLKHLHRDVLEKRPTCIISDMHAGLMAATQRIFRRFDGCHRYYLRHIRSNLMEKFKTNGIKEACTRIGTSLSEEEYNAAWSELRSFNRPAFEWLRFVDPKKWTIYEDGGCRWGNKTTNVSESHNNTLKGCRFLPVKAIVACTLDKTILVFNLAHEEIAASTGTTLSPYYEEMYRTARNIAGGLVVILYNSRDMTYKVTSKTTFRGLESFVVHYADREYSCGFWQAHKFPCPHAIAVCQQRRENPANTLIPSFFKRRCWIEQFRGDFNPIPDYHDPVGWKLVLNNERMIHHKGRGRKRITQARMSMDFQGSRTSRGKPYCTRCRKSGHNAYSCSKSHPPSDRYPYEHLYNADGEHDDTACEDSYHGYNDDDL